jgi:ribonuclease D
VAVDTETTGLDSLNDQVRLLSLDCETVEGGRFTYLIDAFRVDPRPLWEALTSASLVLHNAAFDLAFLARFGFTPAKPVTDTMILSRLLSAGERIAKHDLAAVADRYMKRTLDKSEQAGDWTGPLTPFPGRLRGRRRRRARAAGRGARGAS